MLYQTTSAAATAALAGKLAKELKGGEVLALQGDLGAGKTTFTQGLAQALGVVDNVNSPTFVLLKVYPANQGAIKYLVHVDTYRLSGPQDLQAIGLQDYLGRADTVTVIEWADKIKALLPADTKYIQFNNLTPDTREIVY